MAKYTKAQSQSAARRFLAAYDNLDPRAMQVLLILRMKTYLSQKEILDRIRKLAQ